MAGGSLAHHTLTPQWGEESELGLPTSRLCVSLTGRWPVLPAHRLGKPGLRCVLTLYPDLLQFRHLRDGLLQVLHKLLHLV